MTSNEVRDSILDVDDIQTSSNIYDDNDGGQSCLIITPYLVVDFIPHGILNILVIEVSLSCNLKISTSFKEA